MLTHSHVLEESIQDMSQYAHFEAVRQLEYRLRRMGAAPLDDDFVADEVDLSLRVLAALESDTDALNLFLDLDEYDQAEFIETGHITAAAGRRTRELNDYIRGILNESAKPGEEVESLLFAEDATSVANEEPDVDPVFRLGSLLSILVQNREPREINTTLISGTSEPMSDSGNIPPKSPKVSHQDLKGSADASKPAGRRKRPKRRSKRESNL
jgi:hypothetical protein